MRKQGHSKGLLCGALALAGLALSGCAGNKPLPTMSQPRSSIVAVDLKLKAPIGLFSNRPDKVYFAMVRWEDGLNRGKLVTSDYCFGGRAYLFNAEPGPYAVVGAFYEKDRPPTSSPSIGTHVGPISLSYSPFQGSDKLHYVTYFSKELAYQTKVMLRPGELAFMGSYTVKTSVGMEGADETQLYYKNILVPGEPQGIFAMNFSGNFEWKGSLEKKEEAAPARAKFMESAKKDLKDSAWTSLIR